ncbi:MAG: CoA transferase [Methylacidiphilales bacterium]|nr:CoA transferase [Candidatus Methylacidiphilales bacterium]
MLQNKKKPLRKYRMLDLTHMLSGPFGAMILADLGVETIKVEPLQGEGTRVLLANDKKNSHRGLGAYFLTLNRNKRTISIDLKHKEGLALFYKLVKKSDVVLSNFGPTVPEKLKIDYAHLKKINPKIITCTVTGFGSDGPDFNRPAFDQVAQATGGGMSLTGVDESQMLRAGIPIGDLGGGMFAVMGIITALLEREVSKRGQHVDISMLDCQIAMLNYIATMTMLSGTDQKPIGNSHFVHVPYNSYNTKTGPIIIAVITNNFWTSLKQLLKIPELESSAYDTQPGRLQDKSKIDKLIEKHLCTNTREHWLTKLKEAKIPCAPINTISQALQDPQVQHRNMVVDLIDKKSSKATVKVTGNPIKFSRTPAETFSFPPDLGEDTDWVLSTILKLKKSTIAKLKSTNVVR